MRKNFGNMSLALARRAILIVSTMLMLEATCMNDKYEGLFGMPRIPRRRGFIELDIFEIVTVSQ